KNTIKRSSNSSKQEQLLVRLVEENKHIIENKKSGVISWKDKQEAWKKMEAEFNCQNTQTIREKIFNFRIFGTCHQKKKGSIYPCSTLVASNS
ncbi:Myb DNA-bind 5 domain containing protein, partial [Asbolus verrucosus]